MKKIVILTATRAEYGLLMPIIKKLTDMQGIETKVAVTGAHLSPEFGMTVNEIERDGISIDKKIEILLSGDTSVSISKSMGLAMISFAEYFEESRPDALLVLGDRYETLAVCSVAANARIPIVHLYGGETTEGAVDEAVRHAITKMSYLHFTSTDDYRKRVIQLGEDPTRVFSTGAMGIENVLSIKRMDKKELEASLGCSLGEKYAVGTFHPVTLENASAEQQVDELIEAIRQFKDITFLFTKANADADGRVINKKLAEYATEADNVILVDSLGMVRYLSAISQAEFVIGNSSSGLIEVPSFQIPTINIGDRQKGRIQGETVINCAPDHDEIISALRKAMSEEFRDKIGNSINPYGDGKTSDKIVTVVKDFLINEKFNLKKKFYDVDFQE